MKILYVSQFFYPERAASARRCFDFSNLWAMAGSEVDVATGYPNFPTGDLFEGYDMSLFEHEAVNGIEVYRNGSVIRKNSNLFNRSVLYLSFMLSLIYNIAIRRKIKSSYDTVFGTSGTVFSALAAYLISNVYKTQFIVEYRDITALQIVATSGKKSIYYYIIKYIELFLARRAQMVITVTEGYQEWLVQNSINRSKIRTIPNGFDFNKLPNTVNTKYNTLPSNSLPRVIAYFGTLGISQDLEFWEHILQEIENIGVKFLFIGDGARKEYIKKLEKRFESLEYLSSMDELELERYYELADFNIVSIKLSEEFKHTVPSKIFDILAHANPVLFHGPENGEAARILRESKGGFVLREDPKKAAEQISEIIQLTRDEIQSMGKNGYKYVRDKYNRTVLAKKLHSYIREIIIKEAV